MVIATAIYDGLLNYRDEFAIGEPLISGDPKDGDTTLIDGDFDLLKVARRVLEVLRREKILQKDN